MASTPGSWFEVHYPTIRNFWTVQYGLTEFRHLFTSRQLVALTTFSDLIGEAREKALADARNAGSRLADGGIGAKAYADAVATYLAPVVDRVVDWHSSIATWDSRPSKLQLRNTFARQAIPMTWDFGKGNPFCSSSGTLGSSVELVSLVLEAISHKISGSIANNDSAKQPAHKKTNATDPLYY